MVNVVIRDTQPEDIDELLRNLRECDRLEVEASAGRRRVASALQLTGRMSIWSKSAFADGELANVFGVSPQDFVQGVGCPWMLATPVFDRHPRAVIRLCRGYIPPMLELFPHLVNYVDARNTKSIKWLAWLGFEIHPAAPYGAYKLPFHKFEMKA